MSCSKRFDNASVSEFSPDYPAFLPVKPKPSDNTKEKCRNCLVNILDLSSKISQSVNRNVRNLIQELIDAQLDPEVFCDRIEDLLKARLHPGLADFFKNTLPLLRQSMVMKELVIEGIDLPAAHTAFGNIPAPSAGVIQPIMCNTPIPMPMNDSRYEMTQDVRNQLRMLEEIDSANNKKREKAEKAKLMRAAKSRSKKNQKLTKLKAKEMRRAELAEIRLRETNLAALQAIGPRKKTRLNPAGGSGDAIASTSHAGSSESAGRRHTLRRRATLRDLLFIMEKDKSGCRSLTLYKMYLK